MVTVMPQALYLVWTSLGSHSVGGWVGMRAAMDSLRNLLSLAAIKPWSFQAIGRSLVLYWLNSPNF
jgi:hypothetical protein